MTSKLYYRDNIQVLRIHVKDESANLTCPDPPISSADNYNVHFRAPPCEQSQVQFEAFEDTWHWNDSAAFSTEIAMRGSHLANWLTTALIVLTLLVPARSAHPAEVSYIDVDRESHFARWISLEGPIEQGDFAKISALKSREVVLESIDMWSPGGDVDEAIAMSGFINDNLLEVHGPVRDSCADKSKRTGDAGDAPRRSSNCVCYSACAIVWLTAPLRFNGSDIGVHRAIYDSHYFSGLSAAEASSLYGQLSEKLDRFLTSHEVPKSIVDKMSTTGSAEISVLSSSEIEKAGHVRAFLDELLRAKCTKFRDDAKRAEVISEEITKLEGKIRKALPGIKKYQSEGEDYTAKVLLSIIATLDKKRDGLIAKETKARAPMVNCRRNAILSLRIQAQW